MLTSIIITIRQNDYIVKAIINCGVRKQRFKWLTTRWIWFRW